MSKRRRARECAEHEWTVTENVGLRRTVCRVCGSVTIEPIDHDLGVSGSLVAAAEVSTSDRLNR